jgi:hypothetical protein
MDQPPKASPADAFIQSERELLRDQIAAAWQLHLERVEEELQKGWREHLASALERRFASFAERFEGEVERRVAERAGAAAASAVLAAHESAARLLRRIGQSTDAAAWREALLDAAAQAAERAALFSVVGGEIRHEGHRPADDPSLEALAGLRSPLDNAPALRHAVETLDTVIAMATPGELSDALAGAWSGGEQTSRAVLVPVATGRPGAKRAAAVLIAGGSGQVDLGLLELICPAAGLALECLKPETGGGLVQIAAPGPPPPPAGPAIPPEDEEAHARAQRFARVRVSEMRLYQPHSVREGREHGRLYLALKERMDTAREEYVEQFLSVPSMIDYLHLEVVRSLANHDEKLLGPEYPGPLR